MNPMIPSLHGSKMSSSHPSNTKIMFLDDVQAVNDKILEAPWPGLDTAKNGVLSLLKNVLIPVAKLQAEQHRVGTAKNAKGAHLMNGDTSSHIIATNDTVFAVETSDRSIGFTSYEEVEQSLAEENLQVDAVKVAVAKSINSLLEYVRRIYGSDVEWQTVDKVAYPEET